MDSSPANESHWSPRHVNDSHPGLLSYTTAHGGTDGEDRFLTTSRSDFKEHVKTAHPYARRREMLARFYWKKYSQKFFDEMGKLPCKEDSFSNHSTTYDEMFSVDGFVPKGVLDMIDPEKVKKYPLYGDAALTIYLEKAERIKKNASTKNPGDVFKRCSSFVKKWYDEIE